MLIVREGHTCDACGIPINILHASHVCPSLTISIELLVGEVAIAEQPGGPAAGWQMLIDADGVTFFKTRKNQKNTKSFLTEKISLWLATGRSEIHLGRPNPGYRSVRDRISRYVCLTDP